MKNTKKPMDIEVKLIHPKENEYVRIGCHEVDERVEEITGFIKSRQGNLEGFLNGEIFTIPIMDIYYAESVDEKTFLYLKDETYESRNRLYELEEILESHHFVRISKSLIVNLIKIDSIRPFVNARFLCKLKNGEEVIISRKYVQDLKKKLRGETG